MSEDKQEYGIGKPQGEYIKSVVCDLDKLYKERGTNR